MRRLRLIAFWLALLADPVEAAVRRAWGYLRKVTSGKQN